MSASEKRLTWSDQTRAILEALVDAEDGLTTLQIFERLPAHVREAKYAESSGVPASSSERRMSALGEYVELGYIESTPEDSRRSQITALGRTTLTAYREAASSTVHIPSNIELGQN